MAVALAQPIATASSGSSRVGSLNPSLAGTPGVSDRCVLIVGWDVNPAGGGTGITCTGATGGLTALTPPLPNGSLNFQVFSVTASGIQSPTVTFSGATYASCAYYDYSGCNSINLLATLFGAYGLNQVVGNTPLSWAPLTGDLPFGLFFARDAATPAAQAGWTQTANLNGTAGQFIQLELQTGPAATGNEQSTTAQVTWTTLGGSDTTNTGILLIASAQSPYVLASQVGLEALATDNASIFVSQLGLEELSIGNGACFVSQVGLEVLMTEFPPPPPPPINGGDDIQFLLGGPNGIYPPG